MPVSVLQTLSEKMKIPLNEMEEWWAYAKDSISLEHEGEQYYSTVMSLFKKKLADVYGENHVNPVNEDDGAVSAGSDLGSLPNTSLGIVNPFSGDSGKSVKFTCVSCGYIGRPSGKICPDCGSTLKNDKS